MLVQLIFILGVLYLHFRTHTDCQNVSRWKLRKIANSQAKTEENKFKFLCKTAKLSFFLVFFKTSKKLLIDVTDMAAVNPQKCMSNKNQIN